MDAEEAVHLYGNSSQTPGHGEDCTVQVDSEKLTHSFPVLPSGIRAVIENRSIDRELTVGSNLGQTYISEKALRKTPNGLSWLPDLIRKATENYEKLQAQIEKASAIGEILPFPAWMRFFSDRARILTEDRGSRLRGARRWRPGGFSSSGPFPSPIAALSADSA